MPLNGDDGIRASGVNVVSELQHLLALREQVVTGQSGSPVVRLPRMYAHMHTSVCIQDAVAVAFWLTHLQPTTHCPLTLSRAVFEQVAADVDLPSVHARLQCIRTLWETRIPGDHPMKRAMAAAGVDYM